VQVEGQKSALSFCHLMRALRYLAQCGPSRLRRLAKQESVLCANADKRTEE